MVAGDGKYKGNRFQHLEVLEVRLLLDAFPAWSFDETFYLASYPDVRAAVTAHIFPSGLEHYTRFGQHENRMPTPFFQPDYYLQRYPDVAAAVSSGVVASAYAHFISAGQLEYRWANPAFDDYWYEKSVPEVKAALAAGTVQTGYEYYLRIGRNNGVTPWSVFEEGFYLRRNADVKQAVQAGVFVNAYHHYSLFGERELRAPSVAVPAGTSVSTVENDEPFGLAPRGYFDESMYLRMYSDVAAAVTARAMPSGLYHYLHYGQYEGRDPTPFFDESYYLSAYPEVAAEVAAGTYLTGYEKYVAVGQYNANDPSPYFDIGYCSNSYSSYLMQAWPNREGWPNGRAQYPNVVFDEAQYQMLYPAVSVAIEKGLCTNGFEHYVLYGADHGYDPSLLFDESFYLSSNPDVAAAVAAGTYRNGLEHFLHFGLAEVRRPVPWYHESFYLAEYPDIQSAVTAGQQPSGLRHFLWEGWYEGRKPSASYAPLGVDLGYIQDTGQFRSDNVTVYNDWRLNFTVYGTIPGATVTVYANGTAIATKPAYGYYAHVFGDSATSVLLPDGTYTITARQTEPGQPESGDSPPLLLTIDTNNSQITAITPATPMDQTEVAVNVDYEGPFNSNSMRARLSTTLAAAITVPSDAAATDLRAVAVVGSFAIMADYGNSRIVAYDMTGHSPDLYYYSLPWAKPVDFAVTGTTLIVACEGDGIVLLDASDPTEMQYINSWASPTGAAVVAAADSKAYVGSFTRQTMYVVDIALPSPSLTGQAGLSGPAKDIEADGDSVYVACVSSLLAYDVARPQHPTFLGSYTTGQGATRIAIEGGRAIVASDTGESLVNISLPPYMSSIRVFGLVDGTPYKDVAMERQLLVYASPTILWADYEILDGYNSRAALPKPPRGLAIYGRYIPVVVADSLRLYDLGTSVKGYEEIGDNQYRFYLTGPTTSTLSQIQAVIQRDFY